MWHPPPQKKPPEKTNKQKTKTQRERERNADGNQSWSDLCF